MNELDDATIRAHMRRRAVGAIEPAKVNSLTRSTMTRLDERPRPLQRFLGTAPFGARVGLAAALVIAVSLIAVPLAGGPKRSTAPSTAAATEDSTPAATVDPNILQVLSVAELQRVAALGDELPYRNQIVIADVDVQPDSQPPECAFTVLIGQPGVDLPNQCWVDGHVAKADPPIEVVRPSQDTDILGTVMPARGISGPVIVRIRGENTLELIDHAPRAAGRVAWPLGSFVTAVHNFVRTMDFAPGRFLVGPPYVVDAQLLGGEALPCPTSPAASPARLAAFGCGITGWLAPSDARDPLTIIETNRSHPADWVRVENGSYDRYRPHPGPDAIPGNAPLPGFYLVLPLVRYNPELCFQCDGGAVAILYARLEPVTIP